MYFDFFIQKNNGNISEDESDNSSLNDEAENLNKSFISNNHRKI